jgi:Transposase DDE domain
MYLRTIQRRNRDGSVVRYLQLAHNEWDPSSRQAKAKVLFSFGRADKLDHDAISRLITSLSRALPSSEALSLQAPELQLIDSRPLGGAWLLDQLWQQLGVQQILRGLLRGRRLDPRTERVLFAMVCNRALKAMSKLGCAGWVGEEVVIPGLPEIDDDSCYRAMDWLLEVEAKLAEQVYWSLCNLLNLEVDLLFFDTTSTYFEVDEPDPPTPAAPKGFRSFNGHSKDHRPDLPQVVIGMAVTRDGIPIRIWTWPGNANDQTLIRQVKQDMRDWKLGRVVWVTDAGFNSAKNRNLLQLAGGHYIFGQKLRRDSQDVAAALSRPGPYAKLADNLEIKEVVLDNGTMRDRFVICRNPEAALRDAAWRTEQIEGLEQAIADSDTLPEIKRAELAARLGSQPRFRRFLKLTSNGLLRIDRAKVAEEERLDGKFVVRSSDPTLSARDIALGYKQLWQIERAWRDIKTTLDLRPVYHRKEERIRAHVLLCWLGLLLIRIAENATGQPWTTLRRDLDRMHLVRLKGPMGLVEQRTQTTAKQRAIFRALQVEEPPLFHHLAPADSEPLQTA